jgi:hypothetical protein
MLDIHQAVQSREDNGTWSQFEEEDAIILRGDPCMGKTTFFYTTSYRYARRCRGTYSRLAAIVCQGFFYDNRVT